MIDKQYTRVEEFLKDGFDVSLLGKSVKMDRLKEFFFFQIKLISANEDDNLLAKNPQGKKKKIMFGRESSCLT